MNEITTIHLARQAFTISTDAYHQLKTYIDLIAKQVNDADVIDEIELRMSELLIEHGINKDKVILVSDIDYLKSQLGDPTDFTDNNEANESSTSDTKRLFRDTDNAIIAGVAAGLAKYFGIDVLLIRLIFVILVLITVGWGILLYILLWLLIPEAKTTSDKLQMAGKSVTLNSLKSVVEQADVKSAAHRANQVIARPINRIFCLILKLVGLIFVVFGLGTLFGLVSAVTYYISRSGEWSKNNIFPIGLTEHALMYTFLAVVALLAIFIILIGMAIYKRKWLIKTWITGVLVGLVLIGMAISGALMADVYPNVRNAYFSNTHTTIRSLPAFSNLNITGNGIDNLNFVQSDKYMVALSYYGHPNVNTIKTSVNGGTLLIDSGAFNWHRNCTTLCLPASYRLSITIYSPNAIQLENISAPTPKLIPFYPNP